MRIPINKIDLSKIGYEGYWVETPKSIKEGWLRDMNELSRQEAKGGDEAGDDYERSRLTNLLLLDLVQTWNLDDDDGNPLPITKSLGSQDQKLDVLAQLPVDVIGYIAESITGNRGTVSEPVKDF